uniref:Upregulator of cell proliferation n=1 Tax=Myripristis murdjan TaxID=586833 RepID=A0A667WLR0_9TELE
HSQFVSFSSGASTPKLGERAPCLKEVLSEIGLRERYENKLTLSTIIEIDQTDTAENKPETMQELPWAFLKRLMMMDVNARSVKCISSDDSFSRVNNKGIHPLDIMSALLHCSDGLLQQEIVKKMSLCQFAIPLLLPNQETNEITMLLWSMREIVRKFRLSSLSFSKSACEERIVVSNIPLVSFVRLGKTHLSKSQILNQLLRNPQDRHDTFCHHNMECGDAPKRISDGLVEISWYLPLGVKNQDTFTEPVAVANLRGDIRVFDKQFSFLCETSAAVYIFCDESEADYFKILESRDVKAELFLVIRSLGKHFMLTRMTVKPSLRITNVSLKKKNETELVKTLQESVAKMLQNPTNTVSLENMACKARSCGIQVDEDCEECQSSRKNVEKITRNITNASEFKDKQLPSQGHVWKKLSLLENESCRLRKLGNQSIEHYRKALKSQEEDLRRKQQRLQMTAKMSEFLHVLVSSEVQQYYFLKWLEIDLDNLTRHQVSSLQDQYKDLRQKSPQETERLAEIDKQISDCSLGLGHFLRECGQLYTHACNLPEYSRQRNLLEHLPAMCAQMLLDGFPLELVDGDASNIPMKWITSVLTELHDIMHTNSKIKIITIIGAENTGKSTLLNTMFGLRFPVGVGRCTRGAFIQVISINTEVREEMGCDCIMVIDTEGLKPHQLAQDDNSHERDKEVASLAVGLSDVTIVSISEDNSREISDILEIVLQAFSRLGNVDKRPLCHFMHTNISNMSTHERKKRDKELMEQLNEMIRTDSRMRRDNITDISDLMEHDPKTCNWYIPQLWNGTPPMASFSAEYSDTVHALKKRVIIDLKKRRERDDLTHFVKNIESFWKAL